jgi:hypothetical protein
MKIRELAELVSEIAGVSLSDEPGVDLPETIKDRKINSGKDSRSYQVNFDLYRKHFPLSSQHRSIREGTKALVNFLREIKLDSTLYSQTDFYRLQHLEKLVETEKIDSRVFQ